jgi:hypothetical protein
MELRDIVWQLKEMSLLFSVQSKQTQTIPRRDATTAHGGSGVLARYPCAILIEIDSRVFKATSVHSGKHTIFEVH